jgi:hypothetical protein
MDTDERDHLFCLLDVLGFSKLVTTVGLDSLYEQYKALIKAAEDQQVDGVFFSSRSGHPFFGHQRMQSTYFSDTILFWCPYDIHHLEILATCLKEVVCKSIEIGLPLRGAISIGRAKLGPDNKAFVGEPIVRAVNAEKAQRWIGITLSSCFRKEAYCGGFKADCFLPYEKHLKLGGLSEVTPLVIDFPRQWRKTRKQSLIEAIRKLDRDEEFRPYYANSMAFVEHSEKCDRWWETYGKDNQ